MTMENLIVILVVLAIVGLAIFYVVRSKKKGVKCIGCPEGVHCGKAGCEDCSGCAVGSGRGCCTKDV